MRRFRLGEVALINLSGRNGTSTRGNCPTPNVEVIQRRDLEQNTQAVCGSLATSSCFFAFLAC